ncbi:MAG: hypothetical protein IT582_04490 [Opitutaceae bacterium]|nr:hypothetical protein [Opitutaceae bacterium]
MAISNEQLVAAIKKNPIVTGSIVVALLAAATLYFRAGLAPAAEQKLEELTKQARRMSTNIKYGARLDEELQTLTTANEQLNQRLVDVGQLADNLQYFYALEARTGVKLTDLRQLGLTTVGRGPAKKTQFSPVGFSMSISGSYAQLMDFLQRLEGGRYFCRVLTADFSPVSVEGGNSGSASLARPTDLKLQLSIELLGKSTS